MKLKKICLGLVKILIVFQLCAFFCAAQQAQKEGKPLVNEDVIEMVKNGLDEKIIIAKIKNSSTNFDTSPTEMNQLKNNGVSNNIILAMIGGDVSNTGNNSAKTDKNAIDESSEMIPTIELKAAVGKRRIFVESVDEKSQLTIVDFLKKKGFEVVSNKESTELIAKFTAKTRVSEHGYGQGIFGGGLLGSSKSEVILKMGKLKVYLVDGKKESLIFVEETYAVYESVLYKKAKEFIKEFVDDLQKAEKTTKK